MMKKLLLIAMVMMLAAPAAYASGLGGLMGGSTGGISDLFDTDVSLPDPFEVLEEEGSVMRDNYEFMSGYFCTVYQYTTPLSTGHFISEYTPLATAAGYSVTEVSLREFDGHKGYSVQNGDGKTAYLVFDVQGYLLFLVENGMDYQEAFGNSITINYQGTTYTGKAYAYDGDSYGSKHISYSFDSGALKYFYLDMPMNAKEGSEYYYTESPKYDNDLKLKLDWATGRDAYLFAAYGGGISDMVIGSRDYVRVVVERMEQTNDYVHISGIIEARVNNGKDTFEAEFSCMTEMCLIASFD